MRIYDYPILISGDNGFYLTQNGGTAIMFFVGITVLYISLIELFAYLGLYLGKFIRKKIIERKKK